ncbi:MAG: hypothetical protein C0404_14640 [Verrucomicrobia bacterium]|nr:hypothetical protein [Verrucomicrobiota bacterium]
MNRKECLYTCFECKHRHGGKKMGENETCAAYPGGIPPTLLFGIMQHREPFPGDKGIRFQRKIEDDRVRNSTGPAV